MSDSFTTAAPEATNVASIANVPVRENQMEAEVDRSQLEGQRVMRSIGGGSPEAPPEKFAGALGGRSGGLWRQMQRSYGNQYVGQTIQAKLIVGQPGDVYEQEADKVADAVMRMPELPVSVGAEVTNHVQPMRIQRMCTTCQHEDEEQIHPKESFGQVPTVTPALETQLNATSGGGEPLSESVQTFMETRIGADFSRVRVHKGAEANTLNRELNSQAFTRQRDIYFGAGKYDPASREGKRLLAHELTHVIQQNQAIGTISAVQRQPAEPLPDIDVEPSIANDFDQAIETSWAGASQDEDLLLRALSSRKHLLLTKRTHPPLKKRDDLDWFIADCEKLAMNEIDTLSAFSSAGTELALAAYPKGFPLTWSGRVHAALTLDIDPAALIINLAKSWEELKKRADHLGSDIYAQGLPVTLAHLHRLNGFRLRISDGKADNPSTVGDYARESIRYMQIKWVSTFAFSWEMIVNQTASDIADGIIIPNYLDWKDFVDNKQNILRDLPRRAQNYVAQNEEEVEQIQTDAVKLGDAALLTGMMSGLSSLFGILSAWNDVSILFDEALITADTSVAGSSSGERLWIALKWAWYNNYFSGAASAWAQNLIANGPEILVELALIIILGMIPGVNIAVAIYLLVTVGRDVIGMLDELATSLNDVMQANNVGDLQKASARLAQILTNGAIFILIALITEGIGEAAQRLRKGARELRAADKTLTEEAAQKKSFEQLSAKERKVLETGKVKTAQQIARKFEEFGGACLLGSVICSKFPDDILAEAGSYPKTVHPVPIPKGPFNVRKSALSGVSRDSRVLQKIARENRKLWPHFDKALAEAEKQGLNWPKDSNGNSWEVHHIKQINIGGTNDLDNLFPLPKAEHQLYTDYFNRVRFAIEKRFTKQEWDLIYGDKKDVNL